MIFSSGVTPWNRLSSGSATSYLIAIRQAWYFLPSKFSFAKEEVEFAGIVISKNGIKPTQKYMSAIMTFPTPRNIDDIQSRFGLINQVAYCFASSKVMEPFCHLLSPKSGFVWDEMMEKAFVACKEEIVRLIKNGVFSFDPE